MTAVRRCVLRLDELATVLRSASICEEIDLASPWTGGGREVEGDHARKTLGREAGQATGTRRPKRPRTQRPSVACDTDVSVPVVGQPLGGPAQTASVVAGRAHCVA